MVYSLKLEGNKYSFLTDIARNVKSLFFMLEYEEMLTYTENEAILINLGSTLCQSRYDNTANVLKNFYYVIKCLNMFIIPVGEIKICNHRAIHCHNLQIKQILRSHR